jgi:hypothetical protein
MCPAFAACRCTMYIICCDHKQKVFHNSLNLKKGPIGFVTFYTRFTSFFVVAMHGSLLRLNASLMYGALKMYCS